MRQSSKHGGKVPEKHATQNRGRPVWKGRTLLGRLTSAATRAVLVALMVATPALMLPDVAAESSQITILVALLAAMLTFIEYNSSFPSIIEFRDAPPFNRLRFVALAVTVFLLSTIFRGQTEPSAISGVLTALGRLVGQGLDLPYSPVRLAVLMLPAGAPTHVAESVRTAAGTSYLISLVTIATFLFVLRFLQWPTRHGAFNVWVNLPLFDPTAGGDVIHRLQRDARNNIAIGFLLPFAIPAMVKLVSGLVDPVSLENPQTLIWTMSVWAFLPASLIMRGMAMAKVAELIQDKRRRAYADAQAEAGFQTA